MLQELKEWSPLSRDIPVGIKTMSLVLIPEGIRLSFQVKGVFLFRFLFSLSLQRGFGAIHKSTSPQLYKRSHIKLLPL